MNSELERLTSTIVDAIDDYMDNRGEARGFAKLSWLVPQIESRSDLQANCKLALVQILPDLETILPRYKAYSLLAWEAILWIVEEALWKVPPQDESAVAKCIIAMLDKREPTETLARYHAFQAYRAAGGRVSRRRLDDETALKKNNTAQWGDLVIDACDGAPNAIINFLMEMVASKEVKYNWEFVNIRLPKLRALLGRDFNGGICQIIKAIPDPADRNLLIVRVKAMFGMDLETPHDLLESRVEALENELKALKLKLDDRPGARGKILNFRLSARQIADAVDAIIDYTPSNEDQNFSKLDENEAEPTTGIKPGLNIN